MTAPTSVVPHQVEATGPAAVLDAIASFGRTEDLCLSPDGTRVAVTCFAAGTVAVVDIEVSSGSPPRVRHTALTHLVSDGLAQPHGVDWLDDDTLVVADRAGWMALLAVPEARPGHVVDVTVDPVDVDGEFADVYGPGSVAVTAREPGAAEVLVCNNWGNTITRTRLERRERWTVVDSRTDIRYLLDLPDGVAASSDGAWVAVSNHNRQVVVVYAAGGADDTGDVDRAPVGVLRGTSYPHGLRFSCRGDLLAVADAGAPHIHLHRCGEDGWTVAGYPTAAIEVLTAHEFASGNRRPDEGGPKGLDLDPSEQLLAVTCEGAPLRWFDWRAATSAAAPTAAARVPLEVEALERETALKASLAQLELRLMETETREREAQDLATRRADHIAHVEAQAHELSEWAAGEIESSSRAAEDAHRRLATIQASWAWRLTAPVRRARRALRKSGS